MACGENCLLSVSSAGRYKTNDSFLSVTPGDPITISMANIGMVDLILHPDGDPEGVGVVVRTLNNGRTLLSMPGVYTLGFDYSVLSGMDAGDDVSLHKVICIEEMEDSSCCAQTNMLLSQMLESTPDSPIISLGEVCYVD